MIAFNSPMFYAVIFVLALLYSRVEGPSARRMALFAANVFLLILLLWFRKRHLVFLVVLVGLSYAALCGARRLKNPRPAGFVLVAAVVGFFLFFKYHIFQEVTLAVAPAAGALLKPAVFIGISFFSFRLISVILDALDDPDLHLDFFQFVNYLTFFPCFISGPLDRYSRFVEDAHAGGPLTAEAGYGGVWRITLGCFKKVVVADLLQPFSLDSITPMDFDSFNRWQALLALYVYLFVLYFDFSGYSDIAIGISRLFGIRTPENFDRPLLSRNIQEFWNRWHITLMHWLRDYLFFPVLHVLTRLRLMGNTANICVALLITFLLAGIWHGDGVNFALYGLYHGVLFAGWFLYKRLLETRLSQRQLERYMASRLIRIGAVLLTLNLFTLSLTLFLDRAQFFRVLWRGAAQ